MNKTAKKRWIAGALAAVTVLPLTSGALAASASITTDEAVYVNLDYYGALSDMRIVKGVSLNGETEFTDHGDYTEVYNMSTHDEPILSEGTVSWKLQNPDKQRFYYECIPADASVLQMPWTFDVSYKLNGVPAKAENLAGAAGLVEITIHALPNEQADSYYKDNMTLMVATGIDMDKTKSIDAPGAQIQSMGSYKMVVFLGLPGEDNTYTIRIGADQFESTGMMFMMAPATMSQLDRISDFRDAKDKVDGAEDDLYAGLNELLGTVNSMQGSLNLMSQGIAGLNDVRKQLIDSRGTLDPDSDQSLAAMQKLVEQMDSMVPELLHTQETLTSINTTSNNLVDKMVDSRKDIAQYQKSLKDLSNALDNVEGMMEDFEDKISAGDVGLADVESALDNLGARSTAVSKSLQEMESSLQMLEEIIPTLPPEQQAILQGLMPSVGAVLSSTKSLMDSVAGVSSSTASMVDLLEDYHDIIDDNSGLGGDFASIGKDIAKQGRKTLETVDAATHDIEEFQKTLDSGTEDMKSLLQKSSDLLVVMKETLDSTHQTLADLQNTLRSVRSQSDDHTAKSIDGILDMMQKAIDSTGSTKSLQKANSTLHKTINDEIDDVEGDTNVLNMDNSLELKSFTSGENSSPSSLQFILRTKEISMEDEEDAGADEASAEDEGVLHRIGNIFVKIYKAVTSVFASDE